MMVRSGFATKFIVGASVSVAGAIASPMIAQTQQPSRTYMAWELPNPIIVLDGFKDNTFDIKPISADPNVKAIIWQATKGHEDCVKGDPKKCVAIDSKFDEVYKAAKAKGVLVGGYHFSHAGSIELQAKAFAGIIDKYDLRYAALDIDAAREGVDMSVEDGLIFLQYVHDHTKRGVWPQLYTNRSIATAIAKKYGTKSLYSNTTLWVASPTLSIFPKGVSSSKPYWKPTWADYSFWQFTNDPMCVPGRAADNVTGRKCPYVTRNMDPGIDIEVFNGSTDDLQKLFSWK